jgi:ATP-dependent Lhr-like helicase
MAPPHDQFDYSVLGSQARKVLEFLTNKGASFYLDIVRATRLLKTEVEMALWELVTAGLVSADGFDNLRALTDAKRRAGSGLSGGSSRARHSQGRWGRVNAESYCQRDEHVEAVCWMLLKRYGVVFRELLTRESNMPAWREILLMLRRLEAQGKIRGGRFVAGFLGEQFAVSAAVESLRAAKNAPEKGEIVKVSAADPLNLVGIIVPGTKIAANSAAIVVFENGVFKAVEEPSRSQAP